MQRNGDRPEETGPGAGTGSPVVVGSIVFAVLIALTILEYFVFVWMDRNLPVMIVMNIIDAALIMVYFMHFGRLWRSEGGH
jgi:heme/copper-type cytochrome/quinol oxidase subunit 4